MSLFPKIVDLIACLYEPHPSAHQHVSRAIRDPGRALWGPLVPHDSITNELFFKDKGPGDNTLRRTVVTSHTRLRHCRVLRPAAPGLAVALHVSVSECECV